MTLSRKSDRSGAVPIAVVLLVGVLVIGGLGAYLWYDSDQRSKAIWGPGADFDKGKSILPKTLLIKDYNGADWSIKDYSSLSASVEIQKRPFFDWVTGMEAVDNSTIYRVHYAITPMNGAWEIEQYVDVLAWGTMYYEGKTYTAAAISTATVMEEGWNGSTNYCLPFIVETGGYYKFLAEAERSTNDGASWNTIASENTQKNLNLEV